MEIRDEAVVDPGDRGTHGPRDTGSQSAGQGHEPRDPGGLYDGSSWVYSSSLPPSNCIVRVLTPQHQFDRQISTERIREGKRFSLFWIKNLGEGEENHGGNF